MRYKIVNADDPSELFCVNIEDRDMAQQALDSGYWENNERAKGKRLILVEDL